MPATPHLTAWSDELSVLVEHVGRCVATLEGHDGERSSSGSGFLVDLEGHVVTNEHVVREYPEAMTATIGTESRQQAVIVGRDHHTDLALLVLERPLDRLLELRAGPARLGELCVSIGSPFGIYPESVGVGIVSGLGRDIPREGMRPLEDTIQTDAAINPGNSGGPLVDVRGEVIGVNTASDARGANIGFSIPADTVRYVIEELRTEGIVHRAALGVGVVNEQYVDDGHPAVRLRVERVGKPAAGAFEPGDVLLELEGTAVRERRDLYRFLTKERIGTAVNATVLRGATRHELRVTPFELDAPPAASA
jgi:S1-C subfamily serine protease